MTDQEAARIVGLLATMFNVPAWEPERMQLFARAIMDLDAAAAERAAMEFIAAGDRQQNPGDIRKRVAAASLGNLPDPHAAWAEVQNAIEHCREMPAFSHPAVAETVRLLGTWGALRLTQYVEYKWLKRDFLAAYAAQVERLQMRTQLAAGARPEIGRAEARALLTEINDAIKGDHDDG